MPYTNTDNLTKYGNWTPNSASVDSKNNTYEVIEYPTGLGEERYPYFVMFYINANTKSKLIADPNSSIKQYDVDTTKKANQSIATLAQQNETLTSKVPKWVAAKKRINRAVALPMPVNVGTRYSATYAQANLSNVLGALFSDAISGQGVGGTLKNFGENIAQDMPSMIFKTGVAIAGGAAGALLDKFIGGNGNAGTLIGAGAALSQTDSVKEIALKAAGVARNNRLEQIFSQVNFRTFQLDYYFAPRSKEEADSIKSIIEVFKYHMHPEFNGKTAGSGFLIMPDEFDIEFRFKDTEMNYIHKVSTCALTDVVIDYTPNRHFTAFNGTDIPVTMTLSLSFTEMEPLLRDQISRGY